MGRVNRNRAAPRRIPKSARPRSALRSHSRRFSWLTSYVGSSGVIFMGVAAFVLAHGDWIPGFLFALLGLAALMLAYSRRV